MNTSLLRKADPGRFRGSRRFYLEPGTWLVALACITTTRNGRRRVCWHVEHSSDVAGYLWRDLSQRSEVAIMLPHIKPPA